MRSNFSSIHPLPTKCPGSLKSSNRPSRYVLNGSRALLFLVMMLAWHNTGSPTQQVSALQIGGGIDPSRSERLRLCRVQMHPCRTRCTSQTPQVFQSCARHQKFLRPDAHSSRPPQSYSTSYLVPSSPCSLS